MGATDMTSPLAGTTALTRPIVIQGIKGSLAKLDPRVQVRNPVMFVVYIGSIFTSALGVAALIALPAGASARHVGMRLLLVGLGLGLSTGPANAAAITAVPQEQSAMASATLSMMDAGPVTSSPIFASPPR